MATIDLTALCLINAAALLLLAVGCALEAGQKLKTTGAYVKSKQFGGISGIMLLNAAIPTFQHAENVSTGSILVLMVALAILAFGIPFMTHVMASRHAMWVAKRKSDTIQPL